MFYLLIYAPMMPNEIPDEISLRDVYLILKKHIRLIIGLTAFTMVLALVVSLVLPKTFSSQVIMNLAVNTERPEFKATANSAGLSQGFIQLVNNESLAPELQEERLESIFKAKFDDKKLLLTLTAFGTTPEMALARAEKIQAAALNYFNKQISQAVRINLQGTLAQTEIDLATNTDTLKRLEPLLNSTKGMSNNTQDAAALESRGIDPQLARANNPALVNLSLQISQVKMGLASMQAKQFSLQNILSNQKAFESLLGQGYQIQILAAPAKALDAEAPRPALITALATIAGLLIALMTAFVLEALRPETSSLSLENQNNRRTNPVRQANPSD
jgi:LPS O-antigen subunit length determinant protein (WzzB/FepE family)